MIRLTPAGAPARAARPERRKEKLLHMGAPISADAIRAMFSARLSETYKSEMPRYRAMVELVTRVNENTPGPRPRETGGARDAGEGPSLRVERHGAVRVGTAAELAALRRLFAVAGMAPVGYYDLSIAGLPIHSTAFRPLDEQGLRRSPFRVFASLLRLELIADQEIRNVVAAILARRNILTPRMSALLDQFATVGGFDEEEAREFVAEAMETFRWRPTAAVSNELYRKLYEAHPLIADIACFSGPHVNHLAVPTRDIDAVQNALRAGGFEPKETVEGPPRRRCPILLRQTSFKAQPERIVFDGTRGDGQTTHAARFGEVEQRGAALTKEGRALFDRLLSAASANAGELSTPTHATRYAHELARQFDAFPDGYAELWAKGLAHFRYRPTARERRRSDDPEPSASIQDLLERGSLSIEPILYEDFLPVSAAGIFRSNLADSRDVEVLAQESRENLEEALGCSILDPQSLYASAEADSLAASLDALGLPPKLARRRGTTG